MDIAATHDLNLFNLNVKSRTSLSRNLETQSLWIKSVQYKNAQYTFSGNMLTWKLDVFPLHNQMELEHDALMYMKDWLLSVSRLLCFLPISSCFTDFPFTRL